MKNNIVLIGMPGCGKSTLGVVLAKKLGYRFLDSDLVIQEQYGKTLEELIEENGDEGFIRIENAVNKSIDTRRTVIATGGSVVYGAEAMEHLSNIGTVIYLELSSEELADRLGDLKERGVVSNGKSTVEEIFKDRQQLYEKYAEITVHVHEEKLRDTVEKLYAIVKQI